MKTLPTLKAAILYGWEYLIHTGKEFNATNWQGRKAPAPMFETLWLSWKAPMPQIEQLVKIEVQPNIPWADEHAKERFGGKPLNPPPSHAIWPFNQNGNEAFIKDQVFDHTYPERFWPKHAGDTLEHDLRRTQHKGIRFQYGDLNDVIIKLSLDTETRQAFIPIWFPEDTGQDESVRVPCSLGYHIIIRNNYLHITYFMRSVDMIRHYQDDIYLCWKLAHHIKTELHIEGLQLGYMAFMGVNCHIFMSDKDAIEYKIRKWKNKDQTGK